MHFSEDRMLAEKRNAASYELGEKEYSEINWFFNDFQFKFDTAKFVSVFIHIHVILWPRLMKTGTMLTIYNLANGQKREEKKQSIPMCMYVC